jgi:steroid 5-alpha reductase family enzyme
VITSAWLLLLIGTLVVVAIMFGLWRLGIRNRNFSYVDIGWSVNFAVLAALYGSLAPGYWPRRALIAAMFAAHGLRLGWHLGKRIVGEPEEGRYQQLRRDWSGDATDEQPLDANAERRLNLKFLGFFEFQALLNAFLTLPMLIACFNDTPRLQSLEIAGLAIFVVGLIGESAADAQLAAFKRDPANKARVCDGGLWRYSRHPNYFFEWLIWIAYAVFALASPRGWIALVMPVLMLHFLINVTGLKATEEQALRSKGERYRLYQARTSGFVPWFPKRIEQ